MAIQDLTNLQISSFVVAVGSIDGEGHFQLEGTAFLIGGRGFMVTAGHVAESLRKNPSPVALFERQGAWVVVNIVDGEQHPEEDVAVLKLSKGDWGSIHDISADRHFGSADVEMWAYPETVATEHRASFPPNDPMSLSVRPDLVYFRGYVRRRISRELEVGLIRGKAFYEVSIIGGACASGAPVTLRRFRGGWQVIGVYVGEKTSDYQRATGIVLRSDAFHDWTPSILERKLSEEQHTHG